MTPFPKTNAEIAGLEQLRASLSKSDQNDDAIKAQIAQVDQHLVRLGGPVRVAVLGGPLSGKSSLVNFLTGEDLIPVGTADPTRPPIIMRYSKKPATIAGWWTGIEVIENTLSVAAAAANSPDFVEFRIPNPILQFINFLEMPRAKDESSLSEQLRWVSSRADVVIWCTKASDPWTEEEAKIWSPYAEKLNGRTILAVTHMDQVETSIADVQKQAKERAKNLFQSVVLIATTEAAKAAPKGQVTNPAAWEATGGRDLVSAVLSLSREMRKAEIETVHQLIDVAKESKDAAQKEVKVAQYETVRIFAADTQPIKAGAPPEPGKTPAIKDDTAPTKAVSVEQGEDPKTSLLGLLQARLDSLVEYTNDEEKFRSWEFLNSVVEIADEISNMAAPKGRLTDEAKWLRSQIDDAFGEFNLMQMGGSDEHCINAARLFLQMARDFSWATTTVEEG